MSEQLSISLAVAADMVSLSRASASKLRLPATGSFFTGFEWLTIMLTGAGIAVAILAVFVVAVDGGEPPEHARAMALVTLVVSLAILLLALSRGAIPAARIGALCAFASALAFTQVDALAALLHSHPLPARDWLVAVIAG